MRRSAVADSDETVAGLRRWTKDHDPHVRAAVELLIWHGYWLRREDFRAAVIGEGTTEMWVRWGETAGFRNGPGASASSSELAILYIAVTIGSDAFRLSRMNDEQAGAIVRAFATALGVEVTGRG
jgi:hypothetical protein